MDDTGDVALTRLARAQETHGGVVDLYSTCPQSKFYETGAAYLEAVARTARWSEAQGCAGMLIYTDNSLVDPWLLAQMVLQETERLSPLVAVQPAYMHPYAVAKMVSSLSFLHGRRMALNFVAGGFRGDLLALGDETPHDDRYRRMSEYGSIIVGLLRGEGPVTLDGAHYRVRNLRLTPSLPPELFPAVLMSGSSPAALETARVLGATAIRYPQDPGKEQDTERPTDVPMGLRVGIVAREDAALAWSEAEARFPDDRRGQLMHELAMKSSDSHWHKQLSAEGASSPETPAPEGPAGRSPYWLHPFQQYQTFCPYLVGSYERVATEIGRYLAMGDRALIVDIPREEADLAHANRVLELAATASP